MKAVRDAYTARDKAAITALYCWDGVGPLTKEMYQTGIDIQIRQEEISSVTYMTNCVYRPIAMTNNGVVWVSNLTPIKQIQIDRKVAPPMHKYLRLDVGEKDGRLMFVQMIRQK